MYILDTETTGLDTNAQILEIAIIEYPSLRVVINERVKPHGLTSWDNAMAIHGITPFDVQNARTFDQIWPEISRIIERDRLFIYNASYDIRLIEQSLAPYTLDNYSVPDCYDRVHCVMRDYADYFNNGKWVRLSVAADSVGYTSQLFHSALSDVNATAAVVTALFEHYSVGHYSIKPFGFVP